MTLPPAARQYECMSTSVQTRRSGARPLVQRVARLAERATTPLLPADYLDLFHPLRSGADLRGRIVEVQPETADAATIVIRPGADWAGHVPGQYVRIGIDVDGVRLWRAYSLTHGPRADGLISITVKAVPDGRVSNHLVREARPGTLVHLEQAAGEFVLPADGTKLLFVTGNRLRSIPITGVMPEPAVTNSSLVPSAGEFVLPAACSRWTRVPARARRTRWLLTLPSGTALTVTEIRPSARGPWVRE